MSANPAAAKARRRKTGSAETGTFSAADWCRQAGLSKYAFDQLSADRKPFHIKLSRTSLLVMESPADWMVRLAILDAAEVAK